MKANRYYDSKDPLEIIGMKVDSNSCCHVNISFTIDARHILLAISYEMCGEDEEENVAKLTRKGIEDILKRQLFLAGERWYTSPIDYGEEGEHYNLKENLEKALPIGKKFFPEFFNVPNSIKFMKDLA